jgi:hypothetical protein
MSHHTASKAIIAVCLGLLLGQVAGCCIIEAKQARQRRAIACDPFFGFRPTCWNTHLWPCCCPCPQQAYQPLEQPGADDGRQGVPTKARADEPIPVPPPAPTEVSPKPQAQQPPAPKSLPPQPPLPPTPPQKLKTPTATPNKTSGNVELEFRTSRFDPQPAVESADAVIDMSGGQWATPTSFLR